MRVATLVLIAGLSVAPAFVAPAHAAPQYAWLHGWDAHGRPFDLRTLRGQLVILTFASKNTRDEATDVNDTLLAHVQPGRIALVSVVDLENVPPYGYVEARKRIRQMDQPGVFHVVDERGDLPRAYQVDPLKQVDVFVLGRDGEILGHFVGSQGAEQALKFLDQLK